MTKNNMQTNEFPLNFEYSDFHKGDFVMDAHHGTKWHVIEEIENGVVLEQYPPIGFSNKIHATPDTCKMAFLLLM